jgi:hypothetical protein
MTLSYYHGGVSHPGYNAALQIRTAPPINADKRGYLGRSPSGWLSALIAVVAASWFAKESGGIDLNNSADTRLSGSAQSLGSSKSICVHRRSSAALS